MDTRENWGLYRGGTLKRVLFWIYVALERIRWWFWNNKKEIEPTFVWKDSWFFLWHFFFWDGGRWVIAHFAKVQPLVHELSPDAEKHQHRFNELIARDAQLRSVEQRFIRPTRYRLSIEAGKELCFLYACIADIAPCQYGLPNRLCAKKRMRNYFLVSLAVFIVSCQSFIPDSHFFAWVTLIALFTTVISLAGWCASLSLLRIAREVERIRSKEKIK